MAYPSIVGQNLVVLFQQDTPFIQLRHTPLSSITPQNLLNRYSNEKSAYIKMLMLRAYTEQNREARDRLRNKNDVLRKYVDETYHIENDYIYSLDVRRFNIVPENYIADADKYIADEKAIINF
jgi:hypothetical protein